MNEMQNNKFCPFLSFLLIVMFTFACPVSLYADDSVVKATAAGGLQWSREPRVSMVKERLTISLKKVTVEFEFLNESDQDITAEVGFPLPAYVFETLEPLVYTPINGPRINSSHFDDFAIWIDDKPGKYEIEERAFLHGVEHTNILRKCGIDFGTFGGKSYDARDESEPDDQLTRLPKDKKEQLVKLGLIDESCAPKWTVRKTYHWTQKFPAKKIVRITHEYTPVQAYRASIDPKSLKELDDTCIGDGLFKHLHTVAAKGGDGCVSAAWVKYILTSANTWKTPIKDFELIVDKSGAEYVSFCWDGKVEELDATHFVARAKDFVPTKELTIYFLVLR